MYNHEPTNYSCPFCTTVNGVEGDFPFTKQRDIIYKDENITAFIASHWWPNNKGHILIVPNQHCENIYDISEKDLTAIHSFSKRVSYALKETYGCEGVSVRQHNEPAGNQVIWHFHLHVFPRYIGDELYMSDSKAYLSKPEERIAYADKLRSYFEREL